MLRCTRLSPAWFTIQTSRLRACRSTPQSYWCWLVEHRLRSPPLKCMAFPNASIPLGYAEGEDLNQYQRHAGDAVNRTTELGPLGF